MRTTVVPFLQPGPGALDHAGWLLVDAGGAEQALPDDMPHWDYQATLTLRTAVSIDRDIVLADCTLSPVTDLAVVVTAHSDHTGAHGIVADVAVPASQGRYDLAVEVTIRGHTAGGRLDLITHLIAKSPVPEGPLAARRPGSVLWRARHRTHLEGTGSRFPTDAADFRLSRPAQAHAGWHLHIDTTDPDARFMSAVRLTLNTARPAVARLLAGQEPGGPGLLMDILRWDVTRRLVMTALTWDEVAATPTDHTATTTAGVLRALLARIWPHDEVATLRQRLDHDPSSIELDIQDHARIGAD